MLDCTRDMLKKLSKTLWGKRLIAWVAALYLKLVFKTSTWTTKGSHFPQAYWDSNKPFITCFWHGRLMMLCYAWQGPHIFHMLISNHSDGEIIARTVGHFGVGWVPGSKSKGGSQALRHMVRLFKKGESLGITPDGPRGPREQVSPGIMTIARLTGADILPLSFSVKRGITLKSWDRFLCVLPFNRGCFVWGEPISVDDNDDVFKEKIQRGLDTVMAQARQEISGK